MTIETLKARVQSEPENWRYTDLAALLKTAPVPLDNINENILRSAKATVVTGDGHRLAFIDGVYCADQSNLGDLPLDILQGDERDGYRLILAGQTCLVTSPIELLFTTTGQRTESNVRLHIELGSNGRLSLIEKHVPADKTMTLVDAHITLHSQAKLVHIKVMTGLDVVHVAKTSIRVEEGGFYNNFSLIKGGHLTRNEMEVVLGGKLAQCTLNGVMLLRGHEHADTTTRIIHEAPYGTSREVYKTVLAEQAHGVFQAKILVKPDAQKTDGYQLSRALLLSDQAEMNAKPELEIHADDVKCSHGSTIGDLDIDALFYLRARGLSEVEARGLLIEAFVGELLDEIHIPEGRDLCREKIEGWLNECL